MTTTCTRRIEFDAAHRLPDHDGKCRRLHGHRYVVDVTFEGPLHRLGTPDHGMVIDFGDIDLLLQEIVDTWDHRTLLFVDDPLAKLLIESPFENDVVTLNFVPTAENLAGFIGGRLLNVSDMKMTPRVVRVRVQETPRGSAEWSRTS